MSHLTVFDAPCMYCQHPNEVEVWSAINVKEDPELKNILLGGELNMIECVSCKEVFYAEHFLLYHDPIYELMAFVYPHSYGSEKEKWELKTLADFAQIQVDATPEQKINYDPISLFGFDQLVFLVEDEEEMAIQGEIAAWLSNGSDFRVRKFRPSEARERKLPFVLPYIENPGASPREKVLAGLAKLKVLNDRLTVYAQFESQLRDNPTIDVGVKAP